MSFDEQLGRMRAWLGAYLNGGEPGVVLSDQALTEAAELWEAAQPADPTRLTPEDRGRLAVASHELGWLFFARSSAIPEGSPSDLARAIMWLEPLAGDPTALPESLRAVLGPRADPRVQAGLATNLFESGAMVEPHVLDVVIGLYSLALPGFAPNDPSRATLLSQLGITHFRRYERDGQEQDLDRSVDFLAQALAATPETDPRLPNRTYDLGIAHVRRYERTQALPDLNRGIQETQRAVDIMPADNPVRLTALHDLSAAYMGRFQRSGEPADLDRSIAIGEQTAALLPPGHPHRLTVASNLGLAYQARFARTRMVADLDHAIELFEEAAPAGQPDPSTALARLAIAHRARFANTGDVTDLDAAVDRGEQALAAGSADRAGLLSDLSRSYQARFERAGAPPDADRVIELRELALTTRSADDPDRVSELINLGMAYQLRFERVGASADLDRAMELGERAVAEVSPDSPNRPVALANLAVDHLRRFEYGGQQADLDRAIDLGERADPAGDAGRLGNLSLAYIRRYERIGALVDLARAIELGEHALDLPATEPARHACLVNLSLAYRLRYERLGDLADLDRAIAIWEQEIAAGQASDLERARNASNLSFAYVRRFERTADLRDVDRAIELGEWAAETMPADYVERAGNVSNLGLAHLRRFERTGTQADLARAEVLFGQAVAAVPDGFAMRGAYLANLITVHLARFQRFGRGPDRATLEQLASLVEASMIAPPHVQLVAAGALAKLAHALGEHALATRLYAHAVAMLPLVTPRESGWADQEHSLGKDADVVADAVAAHCALGDPTGAVVVAEQGRAVLLAAQLDARTDLTELDRAHPNLAERFRWVRDQLNSSAASFDLPTGGSSGELGRRREFWAEYDELVTRIRQEPGFGRFLLPPLPADLAPPAAGAVVLVNASRYRSDAIIITDGDPIGVALPDLSLGDVETRAQDLLVATHDPNPLSGVLMRQRVLPDVLTWLWDAIAGRVLDALPEETTRVWWLPIGLLSLFPLHAAGHPGQPGLLDRVVSSYIPTLRALAHAREGRPPGERRQLAVTLTHTPGLPDLPATAREAAILPGQHLADLDATAARVLAALPEATWAHFACHANADLAAPSRTGLWLYDGQLPLPEICRLHLAGAELAYLSACSTANPGWRHADQALHLASAFQLAGYRHVIASLWPLDDQTAADAAAAFYRHLPDGPAAATAATALHRVVQALRTEHPDRPDLWAPFIHSGA